MATLSSTSTDAEVAAAYDDNASYETDASPSKAAAFIEAVRILLRRRPKKAGKGRSQEIEFDMTILRDQILDAQRWLAQYGVSGGGAVAEVAFDDFRSD